ncbi:MAG TPA: hypothetical protein VJ843_05910 [Candidatus Saccharimonadales bacterium]|nr:hypothetical protein [Candidatus Saccharimonadales bacterium]
MHGYLWPREIRERWWLRFFAAIAAAMVLLLAGFIVGSLWAVFGVWPTCHVLVPLVHGVFTLSYLGPAIIGALIFVALFTRFSVWMLIVGLVYPFWFDARRGSYLALFILFMFYGWFFAATYIVYA